MSRSLLLLSGLVGSLLCAGSAASEAPISVTVDNFTRAESDSYFAKFVKRGAFGKLTHQRQPTALDAQDVVRMNRDTLYSSGVFDLDAGPVTLSLPDAGKRYVMAQIIDEDHYTHDIIYPPAAHRITRAEIGTRYAFVIVRTLVDAQDARDVKAAAAVQDSIRVQQPGGPGKFEIPSWDAASLAKIRQALLVLGSSTRDSSRGFGARGEVDPLTYLINTATGWGGNPPAAAIYRSVVPKENDGKTPYQLTVGDVPVDGFWSITVYDSKGFIDKKPIGNSSINDLGAARNQDGSVTVRFGGCSNQVQNCLRIAPGWNYTVRLYRPRKALLDGAWQFPEAAPAG